MRAWRGVTVAAAVAILLALVPAPVAARDVDLRPFAGLGTWVDVYDYVPGFLPNGAPPPISVNSVNDMARLGVRTLFLQAAQDDARITGDTVDPKLLGRFLVRAHEVGVRVVAWYLPTLGDVRADLRRVRALHRFRSHGQGFDGLALDIEWTQGVPDPVARSKAVVDLSKRVRATVGDSTPLGAIVLDPVLLERVNPRYWPGYPWRRIQSYYDVWLPMGYWTNRDSSSGLRNGYVYTDAIISRLRTLLHDRHALVHEIGGVGDTATMADYQGFIRAVRHRGAIGWSIYDFNTTTSGVWARLRGQ